MENLKVSVIVPVYNTSAYIEKCILSLLNQTIDDIEIIAVDDGSTDDSLLILNELASQDARLRIIHHENSGVSTARNRGLEIAKGEYIGFCDSDDWVEPNMYEIMFAAAQKNNADIVFCGIFKNDEPIETMYLDEIFYNRKGIEQTIFPRLICNTDEVSEKKTISGSACSKIFSRSLIQEHNIKFPTAFHYSEDYMFCIIATYYANTYSYVGGQYLYHVRRDAISATKRYYRDYWKEHKSLPDYLRERLSDTSIFESQLHKYRFEIAVSAVRTEVRRLTIGTFFQCFQEIKCVVNDVDLKKDLHKIDAAYLYKTNKAYLFAMKHHFCILLLLLGYRDNRLLMKDLKKK